MDGNEPNNIAKEEEDDAKSYAHSGNIILIVIAILFVVVVVMISIHMYARWYLLRARRNQQLLRHNRPRSRTHFVFYVDPRVTRTAVTTEPSHGLDASVIASLPVFAYFQKTHPEPVQCAVCLSEFQEGETGRVLPRCNHSFHIECIDMWFHSHTTCPLCRAPVEPEPANENRPEMVVTVCEPGSSSGLCVDYQQGGEEQNRTQQVVSSSSPPSIGYLRKPSSHAGVTIEVPRRSESFGDLLGCDSPSTQSSFRLPMSRMVSFKRILSRERKTSVSPSSGSVVGCSSMAELDAERGGREETQFVESDDVALLESKSYPNAKRTHTGGTSGA